MKPFFCVSFLLLAATAHAATLIHTNDILGELEPCGCRSNPLGGMARMENLLKDQKDRSLLVLDAGDLLFPTNTIPPLLKDQSRVQAMDLIEAMNRVHEDAIVPGEKDFALGVKTFEGLKKKSRAKFLAANLTKKNDSLLLAPDAVFERKNKGKRIKIAVFGLVGKADDLPWPKGLKVLSPIETAKREVKKLRPQADLVIALTHEGYEEDRRLAKRVHGIDIIVGGHSQSFLQTPIHVGSTLILQSSFRNQYVGILPLENPLQADDYQLVGLDAGYDSPSGHPSGMDKLVSKFKASVAELNTRLDAKEEALPEATSAGAAAKYQTFPRCAECHLKQFDFWRKTPHALALVALAKKDQAQNKECLSCHSVGLGDPQGFHDINRIAEFQHGGKPAALPFKTFAEYLSRVHEASSLDEKVRVSPELDKVSVRDSTSQLVQAWAPVQCENCHGPGHDHPFSVGYKKTVDTALCLSCHNQERAPDWYTHSGKPDWEKIKAKRMLMSCPVGN